MLALPRPDPYREHLEFARQPRKRKLLIAAIPGDGTFCTRRGIWFESAFVGDEWYFFNPPLHVRPGNYRVEIVRGWPKFVRES